MELIPGGWPDWEPWQWIVFLNVFGAVCGVLMLLERWLYGNGLTKLFRRIKRWWTTKR